jgi:hypothetical protein
MFYIILRNLNSTIIYSAVSVNAFDVYLEDNSTNSFKASVFISKADAAGFISIVQITVQVENSKVTVNENVITSTKDSQFNCRTSIRATKFLVFSTCEASSIFEVYFRLDWTRIH